MRQQDNNKLVGQVIKQQRDINALKTGRQSFSAIKSKPDVLGAKVLVAHATSPPTYQLRVVFGPSRLESNWIIDHAFCDSPDTTFAVGAYVSFILAENGPARIISGGGAAASTAGTFTIPTGWPVSGA